MVEAMSRTPPTAGGARAMRPAGEQRPAYILRSHQNARHRDGCRGITSHDPRPCAKCTFERSASHATDRAGSLARRALEHRLTLTLAHAAHVARHSMIHLWTSARQ